MSYGYYLFHKQEGRRMVKLSDDSRDILMNDYTELTKDDAFLEMIQDKMILLRQIKYKDDDGKYDIYQYDTDTMLERMIYSSECHDTISEWWHDYITPGDDTIELRISKADAFLLML